MDSLGFNVEVQRRKANEALIESSLAPTIGVLQDGHGLNPGQVSAGFEDQVERVEVGLQNEAGLELGSDLLQISEETILCPWLVREVLLEFKEEGKNHLEPEKWVRGYSLFSKLNPLWMLLVHELSDLEPLLIPSLLSLLNDPDQSPTLDFAISLLSSFVWLSLSLPNHVPFDGTLFPSDQLKARFEVKDPFVAPSYLLPQREEDCLVRLVEADALAHPIVLSENVDELCQPKLLLFLVIELQNEGLEVLHQVFFQWSDFPDEVVEELNPQTHFYLMTHRETINDQIDSLCISMNGVEHQSIESLKRGHMIDSVRSKTYPRDTVRLAMVREVFDFFRNE